MVFVIILDRGAWGDAVAEVGPAAPDDAGFVGVEGF